MMRHSRELGTDFAVELPADETGHVGRQCPNPPCGKYFKVESTARFDANTHCLCPYCGHRDEHEEFHTPEQIAYAKSLLTQEVEEAAVRELKRLARDFNRRSRGNILGIEMDVEPSPVQLRRYSEKILETYLACDKCEFQYAVYGVFAFCPECGQHNSVQTLAKNIDIVNKMLDRSDGSADELRQKDIENALAGCVSAFDGFGRELCRIHTAKCSDPAKLVRVSFQNLDGARQNVRYLFGVDLAAGLTADEWTAAVRGFQKRHLFAHKMGVIDAEYGERSRDPHAVAGRKVSVSESEVRELGEIVVKLGRYLTTAYTNP